MRIKSLKIVDILSIKEAVINFEDNGLVLLEGWNFDDSKANGAGKTAIFNALSWNLYDAMPRKISKTEIVRDGCKKGYTETVVDIAGSEYVIRRDRPTNLTVTKDGVIQTINQAQLEKIYQLSYEQFLVSMYSAQNEGQKFIMLNDSEKKDFLLRIMDLQTFAAAKKHVDESIKLLEKTKIIKEKELSAINSKIDAYRDSVNSYSASDIRSKIASTEKSIAEANKAIISLQAIQKPDDSSFVDAETKIFEQLNTLSSIKIKRSQYSNEYNFLQRQIDNLLSSEEQKCPHCNELLTEDKTPHIQELEGQKELIKQKIDKCDDVLSKEHSIKNKLSDLRKERHDTFSQYEKAMGRISELKSFIASQSIDRLKIKLQEIESLDAKIAALEESRTSCVMALRDIGKEMSIKETLSHMYGPTGAPAYIMDNIVDSFNNAVSKYVDMAWGSASYSLKTYKENSKGDITTKFSETLTINGETKSVGSRSGGEQKLLSLCIDFAVIDLLSNNFNIQLNPIILDEPFEHLDTVTRELMMEMLEQISTEHQIWVVDHTTEFKAMFSKTLKVEKKDGISSVVIE